jgi:hypothetical protein
MLEKVRDLKKHDNLRRMSVVITSALFGIFQGKLGIPGFPGYPGPAGQKGEKGALGTAGMRGDKGERVRLSPLHDNRKPITCS